MNRLRVTTLVASVIALFFALGYYIFKQKADESYTIMLEHSYNFELGTGIIGGAFLTFVIALMIWKKQFDKVLCAQLGLITLQFIHLGSSQYFWNSVGTNLKLLVLGITLVFVIFETTIVMYLVFQKLSKKTPKNLEQNQEVVKILKESKARENGK